MVIPLPCTLRSFSSTWSSCPSFYVHSFMILLIISCTKSCGLVAISPYHFHLHHILLMPILITLNHMTLATLVSLNFQNKTWAFNLPLFGNWWQPPQRYEIKPIFNFDSISSPTYVLPWVWFNCAHSYYYQIDVKVYRMDLWSVIPIGVAFIYHP
jgi:hypothetical protein